MATGPLRFRTPYIEELPSTHTRQAPGFAWVAVAGPSAEDPAKNWGTTNRKRARTNLTGGDGAREATSARHRAEADKKIKELNTEGAKDVPIPTAKREGATKAGKTSNTKKILTSGKTFAHYLDDEEAEIALRGRRDLDSDAGGGVLTHRPSKTPIARRKAAQLVKEESSTRGSPAPSTDTHSISLAANPGDAKARGELEEGGDWDVPPLPSQAEIDALLNVPPLTYKEARSAPPPADAPPRRKFCEICGY